MDLNDPSKHSEYSALISSPSSSTIQFLNALNQLYHLLIKIEIGLKFYSIQLNENIQLTIKQSHLYWIEIKKYLISNPLNLFLSSFINNSNILMVIELERNKILQQNSVQQFINSKGVRNSCPIKSVINDPVYVALQSYLHI